MSHELHDSYTHRRPRTTAIMLIAAFKRAEIHKYYEECDWSKKVGRRIAENFNLKGLHRLGINDYLSTFFFIWCN